MGKTLSINSELFRLLPPNEFEVLLENCPQKLLIDVRRPDEYAKAHLDGSLNLDITSSNFHKVISTIPPSTKIFVYCQNGLRTIIAGKHLARLGYIALGLMHGLNQLSVKKDLLASTMKSV